LEEALVEASEVVLEQVSKEVFKGQFKATMMRYRFSNIENLLRGLKTI
jgi:vacuolar-type H+-ATPase subunit C/Vma6